jgi:glycosyltransferase involved in cell wall biosynthesis
MLDSAPAAAPSVSVIVPHFEDLNRLRLCLTALADQDYPVDKFEVIVADNNSPSGSAAVEEAIAGRAKLVVVSQKGAGPARNGGVALASGEILAFIDADCVADRSWIREGVQALQRCDFVGGRVRVCVAQPGAPTSIEAFEAVFAFDNKSYVERLGFTVTANLFCPRWLFEQVGGFRVDVSEDVDWSHRARLKGFNISYSDQSVVYHPARRTWNDLVKKWRRVNAETFSIFLERPAGQLQWVLRSFLLPLSAVVHTPKVILSPELSSWRQRLDALHVLYRLRFWRLGDSLRLVVTSKRS